MAIVHKDFLGEPINPGDYVVLGVAAFAGRSEAFKIIRVDGLTNKMVRLEKSGPSSRSPRLRYPKDMIKITEQQFLMHKLRK